jgi:hypothetical protein
VKCCKDLSDAAAAIIPDKIDLVDVKCINDLAQHARVGGSRHVLGRINFRVTVRQQIHGDATPNVG